MDYTRDADDNFRGNFGYETFDQTVHIPYIFRGEEKYCSQKILRWHIEHLNIKLNPKLTDFTQLFGNFEMNRNEARLFEEINRFHNDCLYPFIFRPLDKLVELSDVGDIFTFLRECEQKSTVGEQYDMKSDVGLIQIQWKASGNDDEWMDIVWPYISKGTKHYVPSHLLNGSSILSASIVLDGIDVMYMRFLYTVLKREIPEKDFKIPCIELDDALAHSMSSNGHTLYRYDKNYWPTKKRTSPNTMPLMNNNDLQFFTKQLDLKPVEKVSKPTVAMTAAMDSPEKVDSHKDASEQEETTQISSSRLRPPKRKPEKKAGSKEKKTKKAEPKKTSRAATSEDYFDVEELLDIMVENGKYKVLVHWKGYSSEHDSWEPVENMNENLKNDVAELRKKYNQNNNKRKKNQ